MRFSIIIPAHNAEAYIRKCLDSIKGQSLKDYELIVICDGCEDNTAQVARQYGAIVKEVNYHHSGYARNAGLNQATGEYVLFLDDDDWYLHEFVLELLDAKLRQENDPDLLYYAFIFKGVAYVNPEGHNYLPAFWDKAFRRRFINNIRVEGEDPYEGDVEFQEKVLQSNPRIIEWNMPLYYYNYMRKGSMSDKRGS